MQEAFDNRRCNVVGQIACNDGGSPLRQIGCEDVALMNVEIRLGREGGCEQIRQMAV